MARLMSRPAATVWRSTERITRRLARILIPRSSRSLAHPRSSARGGPASARTAWPSACDRFVCPLRCDAVAPDESVSIATPWRSFVRRIPLLARAWGGIDLCQRRHRHSAQRLWPSRRPPQSDVCLAEYYFGGSRLGPERQQNHGSSRAGRTAGCCARFAGSLRSFRLFDPPQNRRADLPFIRRAVQRTSCSRAATLPHERTSDIRERSVPPELAIVTTSPRAGATCTSDRRMLEGWSYVTAPSCPRIGSR